jgi:PadR family transcriptional regulator, regulatory protein AphA
MPRQQAPLSLEYILLGFLEQNPTYGYDLYKNISDFDAISLVWRIKQSQLYALLERLEDEGLIYSTIILGETRPNRKQYQITSIGKQTFYAWRNSPVQHEREVRIEFLAKVHFALMTGPEPVLELIEEQKTVCYEWMSKIQNDLMNAPEDQVYERIVFDFRLHHTQATIDWLETTRKIIGTQLQNQSLDNYIPERGE